MLKRTPGRWKWKMTVLDNGDDRVIFVDESDKEIHPTLGDVNLMEAAPEMHELLCRVAALEDMSGLIDEIKILLSRINVERSK